MKSSSRENRSRRKKRSSINILPLVDVMFLLLCFFIFMTLSMVFQHGIGVNLTSSETGDSVKNQKKPLVVTVDESGEFFVQEKSISKGQLRQRLSGLKKDRPVFLNADSQARQKHVIQALDLIRKEQIEDVIFTVKPEP